MILGSSDHLCVVFEEQYGEKKLPISAAIVNAKCMQFNLRLAWLEQKYIHLPRGHNPKKFSESCLV